MILLIIMAAFILNLTVSLTGVADAMTKWVAGLGLSATGLILALIVFYLILGMLMDVLSMQVATIPITYPIATALGVDPIWFGIFIVLMCELGLITPPVGMNLFVVHGIRPDKGSISDAIWGALPYAVIMIGFTLIPVENQLLSAAIDSTALTTVTFPVIYVAVFRTIINNNSQLQHRDRLLKIAHDQLEEKVAERTEEILRANKTLEASIHEISVHQNHMSIIEAMARLMQSCENLDEARTVIATQFIRLLPDKAGALYLFECSRNALDRVTS